MTTYTIDAENTIIAFAWPDQGAKEVSKGAQAFTTQAQLKALTPTGPCPGSSRHGTAWAGAVPLDDLRQVRRFENRTKAVARIWGVVQRLAAAAQPGAEDALVVATASKEASRKAKAKGAPKGAKTAQGPKAGTAREGSKTATIIGMITKGATLAELMHAAGWQPHSIRGFLSTLSRKQGVAIESSRNKAGERYYKVAK